MKTLEQSVMQATGEEIR